MKKLYLHIDNRDTTIQIGRDMLVKLREIKDKKLILLIDENVFALHSSKFLGWNSIIVPQGEKQKSLSFVENVYRKMLEMEADRTSFLVGVGGGLVTDLAGFVASTFMRGIDFGFISTTLLGQVDASIGGKNGVNLDGYKNMIGVIRQPDFVWCDLDLLETLDNKELISGFSEVIKYGAIRDLELFEFLELNINSILSKNADVMEKIISVSAAIKVEIVQSDVREQGDRKLLNFGHTLGHAIEKLSGMLHGEAIAIGMVMAARLSVNLGFLDVEKALRLTSLIEASGLPVSTSFGQEEIFNVLLKDKKRSGESISFILLKDIGEAFIHKIEIDSLKTAINDLY